jgi:hypothetical protein
MSAKMWWSDMAARAILICGSSVSTILTLPVTKYIIQLRLVDLLLPCFAQGKSDKREMKRLIRPLGGIVFGMMGSACVQAMFVIGWFFCMTFRSEFSGIYADILCVLLLSGSILNASSMLAMSFLRIHPVQSRKF